MSVSTVRAAQTPSVKTGRIVYKQDPGTVIGPIRAGMLCLPAGKLRWGDLRIPGEREGEAIIAETLAQAGLNVIPGGGAAKNTAAMTVGVTVEATRLRLCMPGMPRVVGKPKGEGSIRLRWQVTSSDGMPLGAAIVSEVPLDPAGEDPRRSSKMIEQALVEGTHDFIRRRAAR